MRVLVVSKNTWLHQSQFETLLCPQSVFLAFKIQNFSFADYFVDQAILSFSKQDSFHFYRARSWQRQVELASQRAFGSLRHPQIPKPLSLLRSRV